ncbi:MAG: hypothetical protein M1826_007606 [Phylliscum demangeonii]|nr:MAG: hypothetical protein M1826_007606 [Phylliscum demangeonii]
MSVASLLNPLPATQPEGRPGACASSTDAYAPPSSASSASSVEGEPALPSPTASASASSSSNASSHAHASKKAKMVKDGAVFAKGRAKGHVRYPPFDHITDATAQREFRRLAIYPRGRIAEFPRHIPYNSDKKDFLEKTGRESFEVFQYTFRVPGDEAVYTVMWDYNVGLVRITPFFKCCKYSKTTPAKMLNSNPGLREICHSITGGALAAQGYWMPYEAAKAMGATFGYHIRYALVPLFGPDFAARCCHPDDPAFGRMVIDRAIVRQCTADAHTFRLLEAEAGGPSSRDESFVSRSAAATPVAATFRRERTPSARRKTAAGRRPDPYPESGYGTDTDASDRAPRRLKLDAAEPCSWRRTTPGSALARWPPASRPTTTQQPPSELAATKRSRPDREEADDEDESSATTDSTSEYAPTPTPPPPPPPKRRKSLGRSQDMKAAYMLLQLHVADAELAPPRPMTPPPPMLRRRASSLPEGLGRKGMGEEDDVEEMIERR